jgi:hypothetical protein
MGYVIAGLFGRSEVYVVVIFLTDRDTGFEECHGAFSAAGKSGHHREYGDERCQKSQGLLRPEGENGPDWPEDVKGSIIDIDLRERATLFGIRPCSALSVP